MGHSSYTNRLNHRTTKMKWWFLVMGIALLQMAVFIENTEAKARDSDGDGISDVDDTDDDNDGTPDSHDTDDDGDGVPDEEDEDRDTDGDGTPDIADDADDDNDGLLDGEDYDDDGDGIPDTEDEDHPDFDDEN